MMMKPASSQRWENCTEIFNAAVAQPPHERPAFLEGSCDGDDALRRQVETLLQYHNRSGDFLATPAFALAPEILLSDPAALVGQRLGAHRVDAIAGANPAQNFLLSAM